MSFLLSHSALWKSTGALFPLNGKLLRRNRKEADIIVYFHFTTDITPPLTGFSECRLLEWGADDGLGIEERWFNRWSFRKWVTAAGSDRPRWPCCCTLLKVFSRPRWTESGCLKMSKLTTQQSKVGLLGAQHSHVGWWGMRKQNPPWVICLFRDVVKEKTEFLSEIGRFSFPWLVSRKLRCFFVVRKPALFSPAVNTTPPPRILSLLLVGALF